MNNVLEGKTPYNKENWDIFKNDVFSLGLTFMQCVN
jgi:hypothetical protein